MITFESEIIGWAKTEPTVECCGVLLNDLNGLTAAKLTNIAKDPTCTFVMDEKEYLPLLRTGNVWGIWHTEPGPTEEGFSAADLKSASIVGLPHCLYKVDRGTFWYWRPESFKMPLLGRPYVPEILDCYSLAQDFYKELGVEFPDLNRRLMLEDGSLPGAHVFWEQLGFQQVNRPALGRAMLIEFRGNGVPNHIGVLVDANAFIHHLKDRKSQMERFAGFWEHATQWYLRHPKVEEAIKQRGYTTMIPVK